MKVNEIFYSLQGEGRFTGTPAVFLRFSGCNQNCDFCDTHHQQFVEMTETEIVNAISSYPARHIVLTGGEPSLQITPSLIQKLHNAGFFIQMETNGSVMIDNNCNIDWCTVSPKALPVVIEKIDELKVVFWGQDITEWEEMPVKEYRLQPLDTKDEKRNSEILSLTMDYILKHPQWSLSLQTHKILDIR